MAGPTAVLKPDVLAPPSRLHRLGRWTALHPGRVIAVWLILLVGAVYSAGYFTSHLTGNTNVVSGSDSQRALQLVEQEFPERPGETDFVVLRSTADADAAGFRSAVAAAVERYRTEPGVREVTDPAQAPDRLISADRRTVLVPVGLAGSDQDRQAAARPLQELAEQLTTDEVAVWFTGASPLTAASVEQGAADLGTAEMIGLPAAAGVLVLAFGSLVAAAVPLVLGVLAVLAAFGALGVAALFTPFDVFVQTAVSMVGIALGIDYSLFVVTRFREELAAGDSGTREGRADAVGRTLATAGLAVLFSGTTVLVSLIGLWLVRSPKVQSMAIGMVCAVTVMLAISVTLLPALLGLLGRRINWLALPWARRRLAHPDPEHSAWARFTALVMRRPVLIAVIATTGLGAASWPVFGLRYGVDIGAGAVSDSRAGQGFHEVSRAFAPGVLTPIDVVVTNGSRPLTDAQLSALARLSAQVSAHPEVADVVALPDVLRQAGGNTVAVLERVTASGADLASLVDPDRATTVMTVRPVEAADTDATAGLVKQVRADVAETLAGTGLRGHVGGAPAQIVDITAESTRAMPIVIGAVLAASFVLLLIAFRSLVLPLKAIVMNLFTAGAAFGLAVLVFQQGHGAAWFGVDRTGFIQVVLPLFAFALVFGLSMDYEVFMLSRMREEWERTGDNAQAVRLGITHTARVITAAAAIMVVVFASFMFTRVLEIKQMGFMLAVAVLIDATIVRLLLVPSLMRLMGEANWWVPRWLGRLLPKGAAGSH